MRDIIDKRKKFIAGTVLTMVVLAGCGSYNGARAKSTTIGLNSNGSVVNAIIEDFSQSYYDVDELKKSIDTEINDYNSAKGEDLVSLKKLAKDGDNVRVIMTYRSAEDFADFNKETFYYGTASNAAEGGIKLPDSLNDTDGKAAQTSAIENYADRKVVVTADKARIVTPYPIAYVSEDVKLISSTEADLSAVKDDTAVLLLEK
ncbi:MAG: hypothetical protein LKF52_12090 [Butyrivibrio sp.]|jgi:molybdopterin converting factor small subunit|nr:hypothetical protein [Butyrivibrio sp.]